jgi:hypothetical protein
MVEGVAGSVDEVACGGAVTEAMLGETDLRNEMDEPETRIAEKRERDGQDWRGEE